METETAKTMTEFLEEARITMSAKWADSNPNMDPDSARQMDHWRCIFRMGNKQLTVSFSQGFGHNGKAPKAKDVLDCLGSDAASYENARGDFEQWASEFGYDTDSRKAEKTFKAVEKQSFKLKTFLGEDLYNELLWHTERE